jgi:hypothetical protein
VSVPAPAITEASFVECTMCRPDSRASRSAAARTSSKVMGQLPMRGILLLPEPAKGY